MNKKVKWLIGLSIIACAMAAIFFLNLRENIVYYYTPDEIFAKSDLIDKDKEIRVGGFVKKGSVNKDQQSLVMSFVITDLKGHDIVVEHQGAVPNLFKDGQGVIVEGMLTDRGTKMKSRNLIVKHSEEYKAPKQEN